MNKKADILKKQLSKHSIIFKSFSIETEGKWNFDDADWNYKDIPHLEYVHELIDNTPSYISDDIICSIAIQKIPFFFLKFPITLTNYDTSSDTQTYYSTLLFWVLIIESKIISLGNNKTKVVTTYNIGSTLLFQIFYPLIKYLIKKNYNNLMLGDLPMRERRGYLRTKGISFLKKNNSGKYTFPETAELSISKVIFPKKAYKNYKYKIQLKKFINDKVFEIGDDIYGLLIIYQNDTFKIFKRTCDHEGANLTKNCFNYKNNRLICPWHGKVVHPIATLDSTDKQFKNSFIKVSKDEKYLFINYNFY